MSFESFIDTIEKMALPPVLEKHDGGYGYDEKYFGKVFKYKDTLMVVSENAIDEIQIPLVEAIYSAIEDGVGCDVRSALEEHSKPGCTPAQFGEVQGSLNILKSELECINVLLTDEVDLLKNEIVELKDSDSDNTSNDEIESLKAEVEKLRNAKPQISLEVIQKIVEKQVGDAPARTGKIKISTLSMLKESGFSIEEISELAKNDLI